MNTKKLGDGAMTYDSTVDTFKHIAVVRGFLMRVVRSIILRAEAHDLSKLESPEKEVFDEFTPKLAESTYGSDEYKEFLKGMGVALQHHYQVNSHHPEHYPNGILGMSLLDLVEMLCDWKAATMRHNNGDILRSVELNQARFGYSDELKQIFLNSIKELDLS